MKIFLPETNMDLEKYHPLLLEPRADNVL